MRENEERKQLEEKKQRQEMAKIAAEKARKVLFLTLTGQRCRFPGTSLEKLNFQGFCMKKSKNMNLDRNFN